MAVATYTSFDVEYTDTFGGERNYCWVERHVIKRTDANVTDRSLVMEAKREMGLTGIRCDRSSFGSDDIELKPRGHCTVLGITFRDYPYVLVSKDEYYDHLEACQAEYGEVNFEITQRGIISDAPDAVEEATESEARIDGDMIGFRQYSREYGHWLYFKNDDVIL